MACKKFLRNLCNLWFISGILLLSISASLCLADEDAEIQKQAKNICALIEAGKFSEVKAATDKLASDFAGNPDLPEMLYLVAGKCQQFNRFDEAKQICAQIIKDFSDSPWALKAKMGYAMTDAIWLVVSGKFPEAKAVTDKMAVDFAGSPDLPEMLYWIAGRFQQYEGFEGAKQICEQIIRDNPDSPWAKKARMNKAMSEAISLVVSGKYAEAKATMAKMTDDFGANPELPEMLYWITERFQRLDRFEDAKQLYQQIIQNFPDSPWADKSKLFIARINATSLIISQNYNEAKTAIDKMIADFKDNPDLPEALYWITERYEWADKLDEARGVYQQIIQKFPDSLYADRAKLGLRRVDVMALSGSQDGNLAEEAVNRFIADFNGNPELPHSVLLIGAKCFLDAKTPDSAQRAIKILERVMYNLPKTGTTAGMDADLYSCAGDCYFKAGDYNKSLSCYQKVTNECASNYTLAGYSQFRTGKVYEKLGEIGQMPGAEAQLQTRLAFEQLLRKYPNAKDADFARIWLYQHQSK
jgi:TolA-binding protein